MEKSESGIIAPKYANVTLDIVARQLLVELGGWLGLNQNGNIFLVVAWTLKNSTLLLW